MEIKIKTYLLSYSHFKEIVMKHKVHLIWVVTLLLHGITSKFSTSVIKQAYCDFLLFFVR